MNPLRIVSAAIVLSVVCSASAALIPIGEFTGDQFEGFESLGSPGGYPAPYAIMNGQILFDDIYAHTMMIAYSLYSFPTDTYIYPYNGNLMGGSPTGWVTLDFVTPVTEFGGFIGTSDVIDGGSFTFKDATGAIIDNVPLNIGVGEWVWYGWSSTTPIARIELNAAMQIGLPLVFDDLQANFVPEPTALTLVAAGAALSRRRRR